MPDWHQLVTNLQATAAISAAAVLAGAIAFALIRRHQ